MTPDGIENKRRNTREKILTHAEILINDDWYDCRILNISVGGAKLLLDRQIDRGLAVILQIGQFGQFNVTVAWQQSGELGIKFNHDALEMAGVIMGLASYG
jgi:hypothetical protein